MDSTRDDHFKYALRSDRLSSLSAPKREPQALAHGSYVELGPAAGGLTAHYHELGSGSDYVLLVHTGGAGASAYMSWRWNLEAFAGAGYHVLAPDVPGYGLTPPPDPQARVSAPDFLVHFLDALGVSATHVMGNSMGSNAIARLAANHPERVRSVIFTGGEPRIETDESRAVSRKLGQTPRTDFVRTMLSKPELSVDDLRHATGDFFYDREHPAVAPVTEMRLESLKRPGVLQRERDHAFAQIQGGRETFGADDLARIVAPTYLIHGKDERYFYPEELLPTVIDAAVRVCFVLPDCSCTLLSRCGHWPQIERADEFNALALRFLSRNG
jgi:2-hydroxy-6-oxonona-2,4-dienedioate hydrolase